MKLTKQVARKVLKIVDAGLVHGLGEPVPGKMCVEAAVCFAMGLPHGDEPECVSPAVRNFKISLNDCPWSSDAARTAGLRSLAIAQLGSADVVDDRAFQRLLAFKGITRLQPFYIRKYADRYKDKLTAKQTERLLSLAVQFEGAKTAEEVEGIISNNAGFGVGVGVGVGFGVGFGVGVVGFGVGFGVGVGVGVGVGDFKDFFGDRFLNEVAAIGLECLVELKSPGCEWLDLCEAKD